MNAPSTKPTTFFAEIGSNTNTTAGWDAVILPNNVPCKQCIIQVLTGTLATDLTADPIPFAFSSLPDGSAYSIVSSVLIPGVSISTGTLGYVYTGIAGRKIAVTAIA